MTYLFLDVVVLLRMFTLELAGVAACDDCWREVEVQPHDLDIETQHNMHDLLQVPNACSYQQCLGFAASPAYYVIYLLPSLPFHFSKLCKGTVPYMPQGSLPIGKLSC